MSKTRTKASSSKRRMSTGCHISARRSPTTHKAMCRLSKLRYSPIDPLCSTMLTVDLCGLQQQTCGPGAQDPMFADDVWRFVVPQTLDRPRYLLLARPSSLTNKTFLNPHFVIYASHFFIAISQSIPITRPLFSSFVFRTLKRARQQSSENGRRSSQGQAILVSHLGELAASPTLVASRQFSIHTMRSYPHQSIKLLR